MLLIEIFKDGKLVRTRGMEDPRDRFIEIFNEMNKDTEFEARKKLRPNEDRNRRENEPETRISS